MTPEDAALLKEADMSETTALMANPLDLRDLVHDLAQSLRAALAREAELIADAEQEFVVTGRIVERAEDAERERDTLCQAIEGHRAGSLTNDGLWHYHQKATLAAQLTISMRQE